MARITEYVGRDGVRSSEANAYRFGRPLPGDPIQWPNGKLGRVSDLHDPAGSWAEEGELHACCELGSAVLGWDARKRRPTVSISGGPFMCVKLVDLHQTNRLRVVEFWNWGDNSPGAGMGVQYHLARPLFRYVGDSDHYAIR